MSSDPDVNGRSVVTGDDHRQWLSRAGSSFVCTCRWWASYDGKRGPGQHVLAPELGSEIEEGPS